GVGAMQSLEPDLVYGGEALRRPRLPGAQCRVLLRWEAVTAQTVRRRPRRLLADADGVPGLVEAARRDISELRRDQGVLVGEALDLLLDRHFPEEVEELGGYAQSRGDLVALEGRSGDIDRDDDVPAQLPRLVDRQVVGDPAVHQQAAVDLDWRHCPGHRHAGAHRLRYAAAVQHDRFSSLDVGRNGPERNGQLPEVVDLHGRLGEAAEIGLYGDSRQYSLGQREPAVFDAVLWGEQRLVVV